MRCGNGSQCNTSRINDDRMQMKTIRITLMMVFMLIMLTLMILMIIMATIITLLLRMIMVMLMVIRIITTLLILHSHTWGPGRPQPCLHSYNFLTIHGVVLLFHVIASPSSINNGLHLWDSNSFQTAENNNKFHVGSNWTPQICRPTH